MSRHLEVEIEHLKQAIVQVAGIVEQSVAASVRSLDRLDGKLAAQVIADDARIDRIEVDVEEECLKVLALHQPVAIDLRFIIAVLKINNDLERIGDLAVNIAERSACLAQHDPIETPFDLESMSSKSCWMLQKSLDALVHMDVELARAVRVSDDQVDALTRDAFSQVQDRIRQHPEEMERLIHYLSAARHLERIADLATNIAEDVIYMIRGEIVRHKHETLVHQATLKQ